MDKGAIMGMTPEQYFEAFVDPNRLDCHEMPGDIRRAFNAAVSASHLADQYFEFNKRHNPERIVSYSKRSDFIAFLVDQTDGKFQDIRSMSNAYKHLYNANGPSAKYETINSCGSIERLEMQDDDLAEIEEAYFEDREPESRATVVFKRKDGTKGEFLPILDAVVDYLRNLVDESA